MIYLISGNGRGAGKTTLARKLVGDDDTGMVYSHAWAMRRELAQKYPALREQWFSTEQSVKDEPRPLLLGKSIREVMVEYGEGKCQEFGADYWARRLTEYTDGVGWSVLAVDDLRKLVELEVLRAHFHHGDILHLHVQSRHAVREPQYDNDRLADVADYIIRWEE